MSEILEVQLVREAYNLDIFSVFGNDPYTIELILLTQAWMRRSSIGEGDHAHLWGFIKKLGFDIPIPPDATYRDRMRKLWKRDVVKGLKMGGSVREKFDYVLTEYGEAVCEKLVNSLREQIRLEKWRRRIPGGSHEVARGVARITAQERGV